MMLTFEQTLYGGMGLGLLLVLLAAVSVVLPMSLAALTWLRWKMTRSSNNSNTKGDESCLLVGRVSHTRLAPKRHAFQYPIFMFAIDLEQQDTSIKKNSRFDQTMWPLSLIVSFRPDQDHFLHENDKEEANSAGAKSKTQSTTKSKLLFDKICQLVSERTEGKLQPKADTHKIFLVTHLSYYGYCFNPVSFYYVVQRPTGDHETTNDKAPTIDTIVAEVSNTPWLEQYPYVLHPSSTDFVRIENNEVENNHNKINYIFPKRFHVSPFMEMTYLYDWVFDATWNPKSLFVTTAMKRQSDNALQFTATLRVADSTMETLSTTIQDRLNPFAIAWQLARFPFFCVILQIWIHYEAFWLFCKGVAYQPHPTGAETTASRLIGNLMTPLFALQDWWAEVMKRRNGSKKVD